MSSRILQGLAVLTVLTGFGNAALAATAGSGGVGTAFSKNSTNIGVVVGSGSAFNDNYTVLGISAGYYVTRGLELGIDLQRWFSGEPTITKYSPQIRYVITGPQKLKPYVGAFYRRTKFGDYKGIPLDDQDSYGYRAGAYFSTDNRVYIGGGVVYEEFKNCPALTDCSTTSPELIFTVAF